MDTFFGQAPQLAETLRTIIRYNLLATLFGPIKALCFLGGWAFLFLFEGPVPVRGGFLDWEGLCGVTAAVLQ